MILDTNALSAAAEKDPGLTRLLAAAQTVAVPVIVIGEYRSGIARSRHRARYQTWLEDLLAACLILDINNDTTHYYSAIILELKQIGRMIPTNDLWIAALCRQHHLPLLSRDKHFDVVRDLKRLDW